MAMKMVVNVSKKVPMPGIEFSSTQASCSIEAELMSNDPISEARKLFKQVEVIVNDQLNLESKPAQHMPRGSNIGNPKRGNPISPSQLKFLRTLVNKQKNRLPRLLDHYQVHDLDELTIKQASEAIETLK